MTSPEKKKLNLQRCKGGRHSNAETAKSSELKSVSACLAISAFKILSHVFPFKIKMVGTSRVELLTPTVSR